jgi:hypothetical protein
MGQRYATEQGTLPCSFFTHPAVFQNLFLAAVFGRAGVTAK